MNNKNMKESKRETILGQAKAIYEDIIVLLLVNWICVAEKKWSCIGSWKLGV